MLFPRSFSLAVPGVVMLSAVMLAGCGSDDSDADPRQGPGGGPPPAPVTYVVVQSEAVQIDADYTGRLHGSREAEVRARVGGILEARLYEEGEAVEKDAALFRLDEAPFRIAVRRAEAELANARAAVNQAEREWRRVRGLFEQGAVSERERDRAESEHELAESRATLAEAGVAQAQLDLGYTTVRAPIAGVTGLESVTEGNLLAAGDLLTTITQLDPIQVRFALPSSDASARRALVQNGGGGLLEARLESADGRLYEEVGKVDFTAGTVDARTGNVMVRAVFPNPEHRLSPGAMVRVRLAVEQLEGVHLVDAQAVSQGAAGPIVYVIDDENLARARPVRLGPIVAGRQVVIEGLEDGDRVIVNGQVALREGAPVMPEARDARTG